MPASSSEAANRPRWDGRPGFYEIWFLVVFERDARRAWWFRYTTLAPRAGAARATLWAAAFDFAASVPALGLKAILPAAAYAAESTPRFSVRLGDAELTNGTSRGAVDANGHRIAWDLRFTPAPHAAHRAPALLDRLPLPTHAAHANGEVPCSGWVSVDGARHDLGRGVAVQKHIWGTRRVEELVWLYCPQLDGALAGVEATAVRPRRRDPALTTVWLATDDGTVDATGVPAVLGSRLIAARPERVEIVGTSFLRRLRVVARCDPRTLVGWDYRDPAGWDVHVAQSDVASCTVDVEARSHPLAPWRAVRTLRCDGGAALELHGLEPLQGVRYLGWDESG
ncbi:MAG TPA: hypothetical protein VKA21_09195 [Candidatus Binatia bacterium]|nr:hypothetical protein [Candidatus Binatia bacterium]